MKVSLFKMDLYDFFLHNNSSNYLFGKIEEEGKTDICCQGHDPDQLPTSFSRYSLKSY